VVASGKPSAYYLESLRDTTDATGDSVEIALQVLPKPTTAWAAAVTLLLNVIRQPTVFSNSDLLAGTSTLEIPHKYVESVFMPLARYNASRAFLFYDKTKVAGIEADYDRALNLLGITDPRRPKPGESRADSLRSQRTETGGQRAAA
jgi:hypothetical protein